MEDVWRVSDSLMRGSLMKTVATCELQRILL